MSSRNSLMRHKHGFVGFAAAASVPIALSALLSLAVPCAGLMLFFLWTLPSLIHAQAIIKHQSRFVPLPWEDQFAAVIVAFILQIPLWLTAGFIGFLLGAVVFDVLSHSTGAVYASVWFTTTIVAYLGLFFVMLVGMRRIAYRDDPNSKSISIRDAKPIYHPF